MKKGIFFSLLLAITLCVSSCYKIISTTAPSEVTAGETFRIFMTVADDGNEYQSFVSDWSLAGVRVPQGWTVEAASMAHRQYAEDWVYYEDGTRVASRTAMVKNDKLTQMYNDACKKSGYEWFAFSSRTKTPKYMSACYRNGCDSLQVSFNVTVPADCVPGKYTIDFIGGDEEDDDCVDIYNSYTDALSTRVFHVGTFSNSNFEHSQSQYALTVEVVEDPTAITPISADLSGEETIYTPDGKKLSTPQKGINIINGKKVLIE